MICELCDQSTPVTCDHPKNGYCLLYREQCKKDLKSIGKHTLADLETGDTFRYIGSDQNDWHLVTSVDETKVYYAGGYQGDSNYRFDNVPIILK